MIVEEPVRLSESRIWQDVKDYYAAVGIDAWSDIVPFYETSNPYIAESYANLIIRFIQDCMHAGKHHPEEPFYILELGAGSGTFAFYILKHLSKLKKLLGLAHTSMVYVMTDVSQKNTDYWRNQLAFQPYVQEGLLDFAVFDVELEHEIVLQHSARTISASADCRPINPLIAIANYLFDALPQDLFRITNGETQLGLAKVISDREDQGKPDALRLLEAHVEFSYERSTLPFYANPRFTETLASCRARLTDHYLHFPIVALRCIENLIELSAQQLCSIVSDIGFSHQFEFYQRSEPVLSISSGFGAMMVNFDAIGCYFEHIGGDALHQLADYALETSVFLAGFRFNQLPETQYAMDVFVNSRSHGLLFNMYEHLENAMPIHLLLPMLLATRWDPMVFHYNVDTIVEQIRTHSAQFSHLLPTFVQAMAEIADNFYYVPGLPDIFHDIGVFLQEVGEYRQALQYYQRSIAVFGLTETTLYNMGLCHYLLGERESALDSLREALTRNPEFIKAREAIAQIEHEALAENSSL